jgi:integrase
LARLGLRAGDVAGLRLSDIEWTSGMLRLSGKARRQVRLPLPQDVGDALLAYIEQERPRVYQEAVFLTMIVHCSIIYDIRDVDWPSATREERQ